MGASNALPDRFWRKVDRMSPTGCWLWTSTRTDGGYGRFRLDGKMYVSHRLAYEELVGPIPAGLALDHLCRVRNCVNPDHLEPVTHRENVRRGKGVAAANIAKTTCPRGHPYDAIHKDGSRLCKTCNNRNNREYRERLRRVVYFTIMLGTMIGVPPAELLIP